MRTPIHKAWIAEREAAFSPSGAVWEALKDPKYIRTYGQRGGMEPSRRVRPSRRKGGDSQYSTGTFRGN